jgi:hypothetical protein
MDETETERARGETLFGGKGSERNPSSQLTTLHVQSGKLCVWGGRRVVVHVMASRLLHSKRRKKKAFATHHLLKTIFRPVIYWPKHARSLRGRFIITP